jgi:hypothetical protein
MYGANNEPVYGIYGIAGGVGRVDECVHQAPAWKGASWRWAITSSQTYYDQINTGYQIVEKKQDKLLNRIKVHRR